MPFFKDRSGQLWEYDNPDDATRQGMVEASDADIEAHNHALDLQGAPGIGESIGRGLQAGLGAIQQFASSTGIQPPMAGSEAFGPGAMALPALGGAPPQAPAPPAGAETFPGGFDEQAKLAREAHPIAFGAGQGLASAPFAAIAGAAGGAVGGPAVLGASLLGVGAEAATEGVLQEYSDAYFEQRPFELKNVVANTAMFGGLDFAFRGAFKGIGAAFGGKPKGALGSRNVVSEAQGAAREFVDPVGGGSVGAARAADLEEPFVDAIAQMPDSQAMVLARDADDHLHLVSQDASESFTRLNNSLSDDLGNQLKYEDIGTYAQELEPKTLERQAQWWTSVSEDADAAARRINALADGDTTALDFGNLGKKASQTIDDFNRRISETVDPGQRMILVDEFKKRLDKLTLSIDASHSVDAETRKSLKELIAPTRETLRKGLESKKLFGGAADLQKALNKPWHGLLEHWREVQDTLTQKTGHVEFDVSGAGRITRESTVDRMRSVLGKDPRSNQEFGRHLTGVLENLQGLIDARQAYGIARKDGLDAVEQDIRNMMEDWNLAQTIGTARNRVDAMKANPRNIMQRVLNIGETLPMVGKPIQTARTLGEVLQDIHLDPKTPIGRVWDTAYKRFAQNTAFQDPVIISNYRPWVADALKARGGKFQPPAPPTGAVGSPAMPGMPPANANAQRSVAQPGLSAIDRARARASQSGAVVFATGDKSLNIRANKLQKLLDKSDAVTRDAGPIQTRIDEIEQQLANDLPESEIDRLTAEQESLYGKLPEQDDYALTEAVDSFIDRDREALDALLEFGERDISSLSPKKRARAEELKARVDAYDALRQPHVEVVDGVEVILDPAGLARKVLEDLPRENTESGFVDVAKGLATSPLGVGVAVAGGLGARYAMGQEPEPPPQQPPEAAYRDALREIEQAGQMQVRTLATEALKKKPPRGKDRDPLSLFAGKRSIQDAIEETRERLDEIAAGPSTLLEQLGGSAGDLGKTHPTVYSAYVQKATQVAMYLQSVIPKRTATTLLDSRGGALSFDRAWDYAARFVGATQPRVALREVVRGTAPPEMIEALQENWGEELWDPFRIEMMGQVQRMHDAGRHIPSERLRRWDSLLGLNGQLDPSASLDVAAHFIAAQDAELAKRQQAGQQTGAMPSSGQAGAQFRTKLAAVAAERQAV